MTTRRKTLWIIPSQIMGPTQCCYKYEKPGTLVIFLLKDQLKTHTYGDYITDQWVYDAIERGSWIEITEKAALQLIAGCGPLPIQMIISTPTGAK